jgi:hypothetical protein
MADGVANPVTLYGGYPGAEGVAVRSSSGKTVYRPSYEGEVGRCQCKHAKVHGGVMLRSRNEWCRHVLSVNAEALAEQVGLLKARLLGTDVDQAGDQFGAVVTRVLAFRGEEANIIGTAFLLAAYSEGEACADDVHALVGSRIKGDPRIIGVVLGSLLRRGLIRKAGVKASARRETNHGREIKRYVLTDAGRVVVAGLACETRPVFQA